MAMQHAHKYVQQLSSTSINRTVMVLAVSYPTFVFGWQHSDAAMTVMAAVVFLAPDSLGQLYFL
jgi:hypothetical protein